MSNDENKQQFIFARDLKKLLLEVSSKDSKVIASRGKKYQAGSVKTMQQKRRGCGDKIILKGQSTKRPADWKAFLSNDKNKQQFIKLLLEVSSKDSFAIKTQGKDVVLVCKDKAFKLTSADDIKTDREEILSLSIY